MKSIKSILIASFLLALAGCDSKLSYIDEKLYTEENISSTFAYATKLMTSVYTNVPDGFNNVGNSFAACATDNAEHLKQGSDVTLFNLGIWDEFNDPMENWTNSYKGIYRADYMIPIIDTMTLYKDNYDLATKDANMAKLQMHRGEARFLKAYFYFELMKRYGAVPVIRERDEKYEPVGTVTRNSVKEVMAYIDEVCQDAFPFLINKKSYNANTAAAYLGRPFQGSVYALLSRAYLYASSDIYGANGADKQYFLEQSAKNSIALINTKEYSLYNNYNLLFSPSSAIMLSNANPEIIWDVRQPMTSDMESSNQPIGFYNGSGLTNPTQDLVDAYEFKDGSVIDWNDPDLDQKIYKNRDDRFYATIIYNDQMITGRRKVECFEGGLDASNTSGDGTRTGYYLNKHVREDIDLESSKTKTTRHYWPVFRYAEILLNYAEAMNELHGPNADPEGYGLTAVAAINQVRKRAGLSGLDASISKEDFRERLRNERRVEFAFEDHRHWDVRRWGIANEVLNAPVHGVEITRSGNETDGYRFQYKKVEVEERTFETKMYLHPLPSSETLLAAPLAQNPGW